MAALDQWQELQLTARLRLGSPRNGRSLLLPLVIYRLFFLYS